MLVGISQLCAARDRLKWKKIIWSKLCNSMHWVGCLLRSVSNKLLKNNNVEGRRVRRSINPNYLTDQLCVVAPTHRMFGVFMCAVWLCLLDIICLHLCCYIGRKKTTTQNTISSARKRKNIQQNTALPPPVLIF